MALIINGLINSEQKDCFLLIFQKPTFNITIPPKESLTPEAHFV